MTGIVLMLSLHLSAQSQVKNSLQQMIDEDRTTIDVIAGSDRKIHPQILRISETPELLNKIEELQQRSQNQFKTIIDRYDRDTQSAFYEMARYPNMISDLVRSGRPTDAEADHIISNYPQDIQEITRNNAVRYFDVLLQIERLNNEIDRAFQNALEPYDMQTRESVNVLIGYPEIVSALVNDKPFTALLGEAYREDPVWVTNRIDQISREVADRNRQDLDAYKNQIKNDPQAYNEMLEASERFARERNEVRYLDSYGDPIVETRVVNCYPYWFGYPYWYSDPYWRPRPVYYHTGIYRNQYGNVEIIGLPSGFFLHWNSVYHPRLYPHLSYNYYNFYENHYMKRFHEAPRSFPHQGFYRSIESNVINNPRVNNHSLQRIDRKLGNNIVQRPNRYESETTGRGSYGINNSGGSYGIRQGGNAIQRNTDRTNSGTPAGYSNQRQFNTVNPGRSEGNSNPGTNNQANPAVRDNRIVPGQQYNRAPVQQYQRPAAQPNNNQVAPVQQYNNRVTTGQQYNQRPAPAQQNTNRVAPAQQNNNRPAAVQQNNKVVRDQAPPKSSGNSDHLRKEKEGRRER